MVTLSLLRILGACFLVSHLALGVFGKITLESVRNLTGVTRECRGRIERWRRDGVEGGGGGVGVGERRVFDGGRGQLVLSGGDGDRDRDGDRDEIEVTVTAALRILCSDLLMELEKPLVSDMELSSPGDILRDEVCVMVKEDFDGFLKETTLFLYQVQEHQMQWRWGGGSAVKGGLEWLQGLWASRRGNTQDRSFIEQQMVLYKDTGCFEKLNREVLRKDIEVVEYLNDLIDMFW
ncbi:hypothetical protein DSL72_008699 [Monilinia vaccinii-corymbosi]|uniref:Uncharacterized protein n=1 Tax=Monilinia vaccinii-corymbosi TaxID=61207 RepID=A0A8A3PR21_9HELO|nr:hypothetical protein DSL72_008699 [Monilinia vaccinii-corymbosi]